VPEHVRTDRLERERLASEQRLAELAQKEQEMQQRLAEQRQQQIARKNQSRYVHAMTGGPCGRHAGAGGCNTLR
jgi:hypothetical protein